MRFLTGNRMYVGATRTRGSQRAGRLEFLKLILKSEHALPHGDGNRNCCKFGAGEKCTISYLSRSLEGPVIVLWHQQQVLQMNECCES